MALLNPIDAPNGIFELVTEKEIFRPASPPEWDLAKVPFIYEYWGVKTGLICTERRYHGGRIERDWPSGKECEIWQWDFLRVDLSNLPEQVNCLISA